MPAYVAYETLKNFIERLKESGAVPDHIDRTMMPSMSGAVQSHLMTALRFLRLVEGDDDAATESLRRLVRGGPDDWQPVLCDVLHVAYSGITDDVNIATTTDGKLREAFSSATNLSGSMLDRAIRFYLHALKDGGIEVSPYIGARKKRSASGRRAAGQPQRSRRTDRQDQAETKTAVVVNTETPTGMIDIPIPMGDKSGFIRVWAGITEDEFPIVEAMLNAVKVMAEANSRKKGVKTFKLG